MAVLEKCDVTYFYKPQFSNSGSKCDHSWYVVCIVLYNVSTIKSHPQSGNEAAEFLWGFFFFSRGLQRWIANMFTIAILYVFCLFVARPSSSQNMNAALVCGTTLKHGQLSSISFLLHTQSYCTQQSYYCLKNPVKNPSL